MTIDGTHLPRASRKIETGSVQTISSAVGWPLDRTRGCVVRKFAGAASVLLVVSACLAMSALPRPAAAEPTPRVETHPSGIKILRDRSPVVEQLPDKLALALTTAMQESERNPGELAYPYVDRRNGTVVVVGASLAKASQSARRLLANKALSGVPIDAAAAPFVRSELDVLMNDVIGKQPEGLTVYASYPDPENNRVIAEVANPNDAFLYRLADKFPAEAIAVRIVEQSDVGEPAARENDTSPFCGGARVNACTTGIPMDRGSWRGMVTAGHCFPDGGSASTPAQSMGSVKVNINENWRTGHGNSVHVGDHLSR